MVNQIWIYHPFVFSRVLQEDLKQSKYEGRSEDENKEWNKRREITHH